MDTKIAKSHNLGIKAIEYVQVECLKSEAERKCLFFAYFCIPDNDQEHEKSFFLVATPIGCTYSYM